MTPIRHYELPKYGKKCIFTLPYQGISQRVRLIVD
jgi:hypothetical protein